MKISCGNYNYRNFLIDQVIKDVQNQKPNVNIARACQINDISPKSLSPLEQERIRKAAKV